MLDRQKCMSDEVRRLAGIVHDKRAMVEMLGLLNTQTDPDERRKQSIRFEIARAELSQAEADLREAMKPEVAPNSSAGYQR